MKNSATHLSFSVSNIEETISFYSKLFKSPPTKVKRNYAKFELEEPSMVLSFLQSQSDLNLDWTKSGTHFGIRVSTSKEVKDRFKELQTSGIPLQSETDVACCYALQDKFWAIDPDGIRWELYAFLEDSDQFTKPKKENREACCAADTRVDKSLACC
jgi:catechol-2,3-dioxygenase